MRQGCGLNMVLRADSHVTNRAWRVKRYNPIYS
jgi:hypothetical protein